jgi:predicted flavoprotein YhiN
VESENGGPKFAEHFLFTHRGLSGPAMLQISSYWQPPAEVTLNLFPEGDARAWLEENRASAARLDTLLAKRLPERFASAWSAALGPPRPVRHYANKELEDDGSAAGAGTAFHRRSGRCHRLAWRL